MEFGHGEDSVKSKAKLLASYLTYFQKDDLPIKEILQKYLPAGEIIPDLNCQETASKQVCIIYELCQPEYREDLWAELVSNEYLADRAREAGIRHTFKTIDPTISDQHLGRIVVLLHAFISSMQSGVKQVLRLIFSGSKGCYKTTAKPLAFYIFMFGHFPDPNSC